MSAMSEYAIFARAADLTIAAHMADARRAKAAGRPAVAAYHVKRARAIRREARMGFWRGTAMDYAMGF